MALTRSIPPGHLRVFANRDAEPLGSDEPFVTRSWNSGWSDDLDDLHAALRQADVDAAVIQFNFGFFALDKIARLIDRLAHDGKKAFVFLHSTKDIDTPDMRASLREAAPALAKADRLLVHSIHDLNRLKAMGLAANATLFAHGVAAPVAVDHDRLRRSAGLAGKTVIATSGFLLPHKGLCELIAAFAMLRRDDQRLHLLMANALYPAAISLKEHEACQAAIAAAGVEGEVTLITGFLPEADLLALLGLAELVVYPYQQTQESASGAVRLGLASLRPVACSPLPIFDDVASVTHRLPGIEPAAIAAGLRALLDSPERLDEMAARQRAWLADHDWAKLSRRLYGLIRGQCFAP